MKMNMISIGIIMCLLTEGVYSRFCSIGWIEFDGKCYTQYNSYLDWNSAFLTCAGNDLIKGLVSVDTAEINMLLQTNVTHDENVWIGLGFGKYHVLRSIVFWDHSITKYNWTWSDGTQLTYNDWNIASVMSACVLMTKEQRWYTQLCTYPRNFVCEKDMVDGTCGTWLDHTTHCYLFVDALKLNCMNAARFCWNEEAYLLSINNQQEANFVYEMINNKEYWIGLSPFSWSDGTPYQWNNWDDNGPSITKQCAYMNQLTGKWSSGDCEGPDKNRFICQRDIVETIISPSESSIESHTMDHTYDYSAITVSNYSEQQKDGISEYANTNTDVYIAVIAALAVIVVGLVIGMIVVCLYFKRRLSSKARTQEEPTIYYNEVKKENAHTTFQSNKWSNTDNRDPNTTTEDKQTNPYEHLSRDPYENSKTITDGPYATLEI